ncbi:hypothetical protein ACLOJK_006039 [Asimina triloba]
MASEKAAAGRMNLGSQGFEVLKQGLGCLSMTTAYVREKPEPDMIALIRHAVSSSVTFLDTSDVNDPHANELLFSQVSTHPPPSSF